MLLRRRVSCGRVPLAFVDPAVPGSLSGSVSAELGNVERLTDPNRIRLVLEALANAGPTPGATDVDEPFAELKGVRGRRDEESWWRRHGLLFEQLAGRRLNP